MSKKMKTILIKAIIEGDGIINFDSSNQKWLWDKQEDVEYVKYDNVSFGKGRYYPVTKDVKGEQQTYLKKVPIISADCLRHAMYEDSMFIHLPNIMHDDGVLLSAVASPAFIERGYLFPRSGKTIWKRTSPFKLSYAKAVSSSVSSLETFSNTQPKNATKKSEDIDETESKNATEKSENAAGTSFFKREVRGDTTYEVTGAIDLRELGFISLSEVHDRPCVDSDYADRFREKLGARLKSEVPRAGYYDKDHDVYDIPEYGILLTDEQVKFLAQDILKRLARFKVIRTVTGHARTVSIEVKFVDDPLQDRPSDPEGWIKVFSDSNSDYSRFDCSIFDNIELDRGYTFVDLQEKAKEKVDSYKKKIESEQKKQKK